MVELPGLDDPSRVKDLLGKTANLTFRFLSESETDHFGTELLFDEESNEKIRVNKRVIISGESLADAQPQFDNANNQTPERSIPL